jgi:hypothetical protein
LNGRDELNLAEFPFTLLTDRVPKGCKTVYFEDQIIDRATGESISRKVTMTGSDEYGLPTAVDGDIIIGLIQLTKASNNFAAPKVAFSRYELIKLLGWEDDSKSYHRIEQSLNRWIGVTYYYTAWRDKENESWTNEKFHLLDNVSLVDQARRRTLMMRGQAELTLSWFKWNEVVFRSFQAGYLKPLDLSFYYGLRSSISKQMYRYLDKHFGVRRTSELIFDLRTFAFEKVGLSRNYDTGEIKSKLKPAIDELTEAGFLEPLPKEERYFKDGREWKICLRQKAEPLALPVVKVELPPLVTELVQRNVTQATAADLVRRHQADAIQEKIDVFDWLMAKHDKRVARSPAGYLVKSINDNYSVPEGFISKIELQRREDAKVARARKDAETRRQQQQEEARELAERKAVAAYWESLTPEHQAELDAASAAAADPTTLAMETGPFKNLGQSIRRNDYIRRLLATQSVSSEAE